MPSGLRVFQYDLSAPDIVASRQTVAEYDNYQSPFPTTFFQAMLAPDGKIYISSPNGNNILHVINQPDSAGLACNLVQHGLTLPALAGFFIPNFANFRLGALAGSPCDTIKPDTTTTIHVKLDVVLQAPFMQGWPNPFTTEIEFALVPGSEAPGAGYLRVYNNSGQVVSSLKINMLEQYWKINTARWPAGLYFWEVAWDSGLKDRGKFEKTE